MKVTINNQQLDVPQGTTVLQAARASGIEIPTLCDHPELTPYGGCRLCLVEVQGARTLQPSCTLPVNEGMVVTTESPKISEARRFVLTLIFSERNHFCPYCQLSGGDCELQNAALKEGMSNWPLPPNWNQYPVDASHPYFVVDHNRCILCRRCVRACGELVGNFTLGFEERGARSFLVADFGVPQGESSCISCGTCTQVCPTGAIIDRVSAYRGKVTQVEHNPSICVGCSVGCGIDVLTRDNNMIRIEGDWDAPVNAGVICKVGRFLPLNEERHRLETPLLRQGDTLVPATWEEALSSIQANLAPLSGKAGSGVAALASTRLPAETLHTFKQLFTALGSNTITGSEEGATSAPAAALAAELGRPFESGLSSLKEADCVLDLGANLVDNHQVAGFFVKRALPNGVKLVTVDPAANPLDEISSLALHPKEGTDAAFLKGLSAAVVKLGLHKTPAAAPESALADAVTQCGVSQEDLLAAARLLGKAQRPVVIYGKGITTQADLAALKALVEFAALSGASLIGTKGQANSLAAALYGLDGRFELNGHAAAFIAMADEKPSHRLVARLENVPFLVVQASYTSQLTAMADVVLPAAIWSEQSGHYLNLEGRLQEAKRAVVPAEAIWTTQSALEAIASRLGVEVSSDWKGELSARPSPVALTL
jgi:formate dehydrogenase major subunit